MLQRFAFLLLVAAAVALLVLGKADPGFGERTRTGIVDIAAPVLEFLSEPVDAFGAVVTTFNNLMHLREENVRLREENARLLKWQEVARRLEQDNARFRQLMSVAPEPALSFVTARVVGDVGGSYVRTLLVNAGQRDGVLKGQVAVTDAGVVGRVVEVGQRSARILQLSDLNSRVPIMIESSRHKGILSGDNAEQPRIEFLPGNAQVSPGDRVLTSGHGGVFPPGLPVGVVASVTDGIVRVQPLAEAHRIEFVSIVRYDFPKPVAEGEAPQRPGGR